jgi:porphobilinogen deaminase
MNNILPLERLVTAASESRLVKRQEKHIQKLLQGGIEPHYKISILGKTGNRDQLFDKSLSKLGSKDLFIEELEATFLFDSADLKIHSSLDISIDVSKRSPLTAILEIRELH